MAKQKFAPGMRVIIRDEEWMVKKCDTNSYGTQTLQCIGLSALVKDKTAYFISDVEKKVEVIDPAKTRFVADGSSHYASSRLYVESQWRQQIPTDAKIHVGQKAVMNIVPYQFDPALVSLKRPKQRILAADAVGLGKTTEAGILMSELIARGKGRRILVVTVKSMMAQFQKEMWERFTIPLISLDSSAIQRIRRDMPTNHNPFHYHDKTIVSIDTIKRDVEYRTHLENAWWDIIVIDEAHNVARRGNHEAQRARLAQLLASRSDTLIMLSATPHDGSARSFASLINMLDPTAIPDPDNYTQEDIKDNGDDIKGLFLRRFKKDIQDQTDGKFMQRHIAEEKCSASLLEEYALDQFAALEEQIEHTDGSGLRGIVLKKAMFSSPAACIKSVDARLRTLKEHFDDSAMKEKAALENLRHALVQIQPQDFSRYIRLLNLLRDSKYAWDYKAIDDRLVIFTERIETMRWLAEHLQQDLKLPKDAVVTLHGGMSDVDQQKIVEEFGRTEAPVRVLVASDVASEGINLHYLCHRMIHFDIPWSLMVFQQRNGRIDRYGQTKDPDIRYMVIETANQRIRGDIRILEILIRKENQATLNIGDPATLMNVYDIDEEEHITAKAMQSGDADAFDKLLTSNQEDDFDLWGSLFGEDEEPEKPRFEDNLCEDRTLMSDMDFVEGVFRHLSASRHYQVDHLQTVPGLEISVTKDIAHAFRNVMPYEIALHEGELLRLSPDRDFCAKEIKRSMENSMGTAAWPQTQYLWKQHPIMQWVSDRAGQFFGRQEAPLIGVHGKLKPDEQIFIISGLIPNRRSQPLVDEWFGLRFVGGRFVEQLTMEQVIERTGFRDNNMPNSGSINSDDLSTAAALLPTVVQKAKEHMTASYKAYENGPYQAIYPEMEKLEAMKKRHRQHIEIKYEQMTIFGKERRRDQELEKIDKLFDEFFTWVKDAMDIEDNPYIRIIAGFKGV